MRGGLSYLNFDLVIRRVEGGYRAQVVSSPAGEASVDFTAPFSELELENFLLRIGRPRRSTRRRDSPEMEAVRALGGRLYEAVFSGGIRDCWASSLTSAEARNAGLRLRLRIGDAPELSDVPWEYLYNASLNQFLSLSEYTPLIRYPDLPRRIRPLTVSPPLEILAMISSPSDYPQLDVEQEWSQLNNALTGPIGNNQIRLTRLTEASLSVLQRELRRRDYHVLHFVGHGGFDPGTEDGVVVLCDEAGKGRLVTAERLGTILHDHRSLRLVVLNACEGARSSRTDPFAGVAQSLVQQGVPAVIAMQFEITDQAAIVFAHEFYAATADGYPVDAALAAARKAIFAAENETEWGTPVLFLRAPDGRLFSVTARASTLEAQSSPPVAEREEDDPATKRRGSPPADLTVFRDALFAPELVVIPAGEFMMGSREGEPGSEDDERPRHRVTIGRRFAIGRFPMTFDEYDRFCEAKGRAKPADMGWGRGRRPVINISWEDAQAYVSWLSLATGEPYRLPSEAEWEYACRAGTTSRYSSGDAITAKDANYDGPKPSQVGAYSANPWGLHDMHGNVWEWVEDRWHENYRGAPADESAWKDAEAGRNPRLRVLRGGSWLFNSWYCRSACRLRVGADLRNYAFGFRVTRTLS